MTEQLEELECQNHANCGDYCETEREREMVLCEDCLDSFDQRQRDQAELKTLRGKVVDLQSRLDAAEKRARKAEADSRRILKAHKGLERVARVVSDNSDQVCGENNLLRQQLAERDAKLAEAVAIIERVKVKGLVSPNCPLGKRIDALLSSAEPVFPMDQILPAS